MMKEGSDIDSETYRMCTPQGVPFDPSVLERLSFRMRQQRVERPSRFRRGSIAASGVGIGLHHIAHLVKHM